MDTPSPLPWRMTLEEFTQRGAPCPPAIAQEMDAARAPLWTLRTELRMLEETILTTARRRTCALTALEHERELKAALRSSRVSKDLRVKYKTTAAELARLTQAFETTYDPAVLHRRIVAEALAMGLPVPAGVRRGHPNLDPAAAVTPTA